MKLFCKHTYETITLEFVHDKWINESGINKKYIAIYKCSKCGKIKKGEVYIYTDNFAHSRFL